MLTRTFWNALVRLIVSSEKKKLHQRRLRIETYLTLTALCISESCIKMKINLQFYFHTSLWCLKRFYESLHKTFWNTKILVNFFSGSWIRKGKVKKAAVIIHSNKNLRRKLNKIYATPLTNTCHTNIRVNLLPIFSVSKKK